MTISRSGNVVFSDQAATTVHDVVLPNVADHETVVFLLLDRTGTGVISGVTDSASGSYTRRSNYSDAGYISEMWVREDAAANASLTVTATSTGNITSQVYACRLTSDAGGVVYPTFDVAATPLNDPANNTDTDSPLANGTAAGIIVGGLYAGDAQPADPTIDGAGETYGPVGATPGRHGFMFFESYASAGNHGFEVTLADACNTTFHVLAFKESVASGVVNTVVASDGLSIDDGFISSVHRMRVSIELTEITEGPTLRSVINQAQIFDSIQIIDEYLRHIIRNSVSSETTLVVDSFLSSIANQQFINAVASDIVSFYSQLVASAYRNRQNDDVVEVIDVNAFHMLRNAITVDTFNIIDSISSLFYGVQVVDVSKIIVGVDQPNIELGGYSV